MQTNPEKLPIAPGGVLFFVHAPKNVLCPSHFFLLPVEALLGTLYSNGVKLWLGLYLLLVNNIAMIDRITLECKANKTISNEFCY